MWLAAREMKKQDKLNKRKPKTDPKLKRSYSEIESLSIQVKKLEQELDEVKKRR